MTQTVTGQITGLHRLPNSHNGNPRWRVEAVTAEMGEVALHTPADGAIGYEIDNPEYRQGTCTMIIRNGLLTEVHA